MENKRMHNGPSTADSAADLWRTVLKRMDRLRRDEIGGGGNPESGSAWPLSAYQLPLFFLAGQNPGDNRYNEYLVLKLEGALCPAAFKRALEGMVRRHAVFRTEIFYENGSAWQREMTGGGPVPVFREFPGKTPEEVNVYLTEEINRGFDLSSPPYVRFYLLTLGEEHRIFMMVAHHLIFDAQSFPVFLKGLSQYYRELTGNRASGAEPGHYRNFSAWSLSREHSTRIEAQLPYWERQLAGASGRLALRQFPQSREPAGGAIHGVRLTPRQVAGLEELGSAAGATPFMTFLACFNILLCKYTDERDICIGTPVSLRNRREFFSVIGFFVNTLVLRTALKGSDTFTDFLGRTCRTVLEGLAHQDPPLQSVVRRLNPERAPGINPLFQVMFVFWEEFGGQMALPGVTASVYDVKRQFAKFDLTLAMVRRRQEVVCEFEYDRRCFSEAGIKTLAGSFLFLIDSFISSPRRLVSEFGLLPPEGRARVLRGGRGAAMAELKGRRLPLVFRKAVLRNPEKVAVREGGRSVSYRELDRISDGLACRILDHAGPGDRIGLFLNRSVEAVAGMLAVLKAGCAYVPVDPATPEARIRRMAESAGIRLVVAAPGGPPFLKEIFNRIMVIDRETQTGGSPPSVSFELDEAAVFYTSGSTGRPKGVTITHEGLISLVRENDYIDFHPSQVFLQSAPVGFDASSFEIWGALLNGCELVIYAEPHMDIFRLSDLICARGITTVWMTTDLFHHVVEYHVRLLRGVRQLLTGGDRMNRELVKKAYRELPHTTVTVFYGPTENTTFSTYFPVKTSGFIGMPLGKPLAGRSIYILDRDGHLKPPGVEGEICLGGNGLAAAYLGEPGLTKERFRASPFLPEAGRLYRTGDFGSCGEDNTFYFTGRRDGQIKLRGFRIEPGDVESVLLTHPQIFQCAVLPEVNPDTGQKQLVAYVGQKTDPSPKGHTLDTGELEALVRRHLPGYMHPASYRFLSEFPVTPNGKLDRKALGTATACGPQACRTPVYPDTVVQETLAQIWKTVLGMESFNRGVSHIDIHENFFQLGGDSMTAIRFLSDVERSFGVRIPAAQLFSDPTIAGLARIVRTDDRRDRVECFPGASMVTLRDGTGSPLFIIPGGGMGRTELLHYPKVIYRLDPCPVYGFMAAGLESGHPDGFTSLEHLAGVFVSLMERRDLSGGYHLMGDCIGGVLALEVAVRLEKRGLSPRCLILVDTEYPRRKGGFPAFVSPVQYWKTRLFPICSRTVDFFSRIWKERAYFIQAAGQEKTVSGKIRYGCDKALKAVHYIYSDILKNREVAGNAAPPGPQAAAGPPAEVFRALVNRYRPVRYGGRTCFLLTGDLNQDRLNASWKRRFSSEISFYKLAGDHYSYLGRCYRETAETLNQVLFTYGGD